MWAISRPVLLPWSVEFLWTLAFVSRLRSIEACSDLCLVRVPVKLDVIRNQASARISEVFSIAT